MNRLESQPSTECDKEVLHLKGLVQSHGVLVVLKTEDLRIESISANAEDVFRLKPEQLIDRPLATFLSPVLSSSISVALSNSSAPYSNPLNIVVEAEGVAVDCDGIVHQLGDDRLILELEPKLDRETGGGVFDRSIEHYFNLTSESLASIRECESIREAGQKVCEKLKSFTGFDRVMLYVFAPDLHGEVMAEAREQSLEPFLGLHYPATDIPAQARELYTKNLIRLIADVESEPVAIVPEAYEVDMTDCSLRAVSPIHIQYLKNMGVRASMSISLVDGDELWALIACHHYSGPLRVPYSVRVSAVHFGLVVSAQLRSMQREFHSRELVTRQKRIADEMASISEGSNLREALHRRRKSLMELFDADGFAFLQRGELTTEGVALHSETIQRAIDIFFPHAESNLVVSDSITSDFPEIEAASEGVAGLLGIRCGRNTALFLFRKEFVHSVRWAGRPDSPEVSKPLTPRQSFSEWAETVKGLSRAWTDIDLTVARELRSSLMAFIVQQNLQLERLNEELQERNAEIQQFAYSVSHDLKSPLVTINGWIGALEEDLDAGNQEEIHKTIERIRRASHRMGRLIEDLLHFSRIGRMNEEIALVDMDKVGEELAQEFGARFSGAEATLTILRPLPSFRGYPDEVFRVFRNLIDNALKYGLSDECRVVEVHGEERKEFIRYAVRDSGPGVEPAFQMRIFELFQRLDARQPGTGVGLASVAKVAQLHRGRCGVLNRKSGGAEFWVEFPKFIDES